MTTRNVKSASPENRLDANHSNSKEGHACENLHAPEKNTFLHQMFHHFVMIFRQRFLPTSRRHKRSRPEQIKLQTAGTYPSLKARKVQFQRWCVRFSWHDYTPALPQESNSLEVKYA